MASRTPARTAVVVCLDDDVDRLLGTLAARLADEHDDPVDVIAVAPAAWWYGMALGTAVLDGETTVELQEVHRAERARADAAAAELRSGIERLAPGSRVKVVALRRTAAVRLARRAGHERVWVVARTASPHRWRWRGLAVVEAVTLRARPVTPAQR